MVSQIVSKISIFVVGIAKEKDLNILGTISSFLDPALILNNKMEVIRCIHTADNLEVNPQSPYEELEDHPYLEIRPESDNEKPVDTLYQNVCPESPYEEIDDSSYQDIRPPFHFEEVKGISHQESHHPYTGLDLNRRKYAGNYVNID